MKNLLCVVALVPIFSFAQTIVNGTVTGQPQKAISFYFYDDAVRGELIVKDTVTDSNGSVVFQFYENCERPLRVSYEIAADSNTPRWRDFYLWIKPGKLNRFRIENDTCIFYEATSVNENNLLKELGIHETVRAIKHSGESFDEFEKKVDQALIGRLLVLEKRHKQYVFGEEFRQFVHAQLLYSAYRTIMEALTFADGNQFKRFMTSFDFLSDKAYPSLTYRNGLREYFDILTSHDRKDFGHSYLLQYFRLLDQKLKNHPKTKEFLKTDVLRTYGFTIETNIDTLKEAVESILREAPDSRYKDYLAKKLALKIRLVNAAQSLPNIELRDTTGNLINLKSFAGKVVFIDFWGSWCAPCMTEMPFSQELHRFFNKDVVFVYINSPVEPESRWKRTIQKLNLQGVHLKLSSVDESKLKAFYSFDGYPFYMIHDASGRPLNVEGGIRPSDNARKILETVIK
jgi:thiol-disulfide isomerase/thioredoxin